MANRILDTNILIKLWKGEYQIAGRVISDETAKTAARAWLKLSPRDVIVTPVRIEFLAGTRSRDELRLADIFLDEFQIADAGRVLPEDWSEAERLARRVPRDGRPRGAIDCLITAIANRLHLEIRSNDSGMPRTGRS